MFAKVVLVQFDSRRCAEWIFSSMARAWGLSMCLQVPVRADASDNGSSFVELQGHFNGMGQEIKTIQGIDNHDTGIVLLF